MSIANIASLMELHIGTMDNQSHNGLHVMCATGVTNSSMNDIYDEIVIAAALLQERISHAAMLAVTDKPFSLEDISTILSSVERFLVALEPTTLPQAKSADNSLAVVEEVVIT